jgi:DNA-directed RNA polymerase alpha subunit
MRKALVTWTIGAVTNRRSGMPGKGFTTEEAMLYGTRIGIDWAISPYDVEQFRAGMNVELEHGVHDPETDVTGDDPIVTAKIARAHLNEFPDYYTRLERMEEEARQELHQTA